MTMDGPTEARPGETVAYRLTYHTTGTDAVVAVPPGTSYVSSRLLNREGQLGWDRGLIRWGLSPGDGVLELTFRIGDDAGPGDSFSVDAYEPGTETTSSNRVVTTILESQ